MIRFSKEYILVNADFDNKLIKKHLYKDLIEYWIYRSKESSIFLPDGSKAIATATPNYLHAIIVCENKHITKKTVQTILVSGYKFTEEHLEDYLKKTHRGING